MKAINFTQRRKDQERRQVLLGPSLYNFAPLRETVSEEDPHPKLNVTRLREGGVQGAEVRVVSLTQTIKLQTIQCRDIECVRVRGREPFRKLDMEEIQRYRTTRQTAVNDQVVDLRQRRGTSWSKTIPRIDISLRQ